MDTPLSVRFDAKYNKNISQYESNIFPKETNAITKIGVFRPKKFLVKCDGHGKMGFTKFEDPYETIKKFSKLKEEGRITKEEFEKTKKKILDDMT